MVKKTAAPPPAAKPAAGPSNEGLGSALSTFGGPARAELSAAAGLTESQVRLARKALARHRERVARDADAAGETGRA